MGNKPQKKGVLGIIYGDYWIKRKKLILSGFLIPLFFSLLTFHIMFSIYGMQLELRSLLFKIVTKIGKLYWIAFFLIPLCLTTAFSLVQGITFSIYETTLKNTWNEIYKEKKIRPRSALVKNLCIMAIRMWEKSGKYLLTIFLYIITIPLGILVGYVIYVYLNLFSIDHIINFISITPFIGNALREIAEFLTKTIVKDFLRFFVDIPSIYRTFIIIITTFLLFPISDLMENYVLKRQRGNFRYILKNGMRFVILNLNLPDKIATFCYYTSLCLFTDQKTVALNIPIINDRNVEDAIKKILGINQDCYVTRLPFLLNTEEFIQELDKMPDELLEEIKLHLEKVKVEIHKLKFEVTKQLSEKVSKIETLQRDYIVYGIGANGCTAYAIVNVPPPRQLTRIVTRLWCNDSHIKDTIIKEIEKLESS